VGRKDQGLQNGRRRYRAIPRVLVFLRDGPDVLLLKGAPTKRLWPGLYNGLGGHVEAGEDVLSAARREVLEEAGVEPAGLHLRAVVNVAAGDPGLGILFFVFVGECTGRATHSSAEGELHWVPAEGVGELELVEDLYWLLPRVLAADPAGEPLYLHYSYDEGDGLVIREAAGR
jgi:8-oxo-dGTP diphosphatase